MIITIIICLLLVGLCIGLGSVSISVRDAAAVIMSRIRGAEVSDTVDPSVVAIFWTIRMPRVLTSFMTGGALALSGVIMQAVLQNPLASSYTLGVSSGSSLGAALVIVSEITVPWLGNLLLPSAGFVFGLATVFIVLALASCFGDGMHTNTIILIGMVVSLFVNALLTLVSAFADAHAQQLILWQMGSFSGKRWMHVQILSVVCIVCLVLIMRRFRDLDIMSFGDESATVMGVDVGRSKRVLLILAALITGVSVCFSGTIGFVDLIAPHVVRRMFGSPHRRLLPMSFVIGGSFMAVCDMISRTLLAPREIPVGAVTAIIGAPFFVWLYLRKR
jgi:iron complex transport system permease protein